jgi:hypothetical protein
LLALGTPRAARAGTECLPGPPINITAPAITPTSDIVSGALTVSNGTWDNTTCNPAPTSYTYQWKRNAATIAYATSASYIIEFADISDRLSATVTGCNGYGECTTIDASNSVEVSPTNTQLPEVSGGTNTGEVQTATAGLWSGSGTLSYTYQWQRCNEAAYQADVLANSSAGYWRLGEASGTIVSDTTTNNNDGTVYNGTSLGQPGGLAGDSNTSYAFDGSNDYASIPNATSLNPTSSISLETWFKPTAGPG